MEKDIGHYILYSDGRVYSKYRERFLKGSPNSDGYIQVALNGKLLKLHRLIAEHFIPVDPDKLIVNHINGIKIDNRVENLEWCTRLHNVRHAYANNLMTNAVHRGSKNGWAKLSEAQVIDIKTKLRSGMSQTAIAKEFSVHVSTIHLIKKERNWGHLTI
jgi:hypothetical protein